MGEPHTFRLLVLGASDDARAVLRSVADAPLVPVTLPALSARTGVPVPSTTMAWVARRTCPGPDGSTIGLVVLGVDRDEVAVETVAALVEEVDVVCALSSADARTSLERYLHLTELAGVLTSARVPVVVTVPDGSPDHVPVRLPGRARVPHRPGDVRSDREVIAAALEQLLVTAPTGPVREVA